MTDPLFSIVIPTYNRAHTIPNAISSCVSQTCQSFEIIVVDDNKSTDDIGQALAPFMNQCAINLVPGHQGKAASARNAGVRLAKGRYVAFLDADDAYLPEKLEICQRHLELEPQTLFYSQNYIDRGVAGRYWIKPSRGLGEGENIFDYLFLHKGWIHPSSIVVDAELARNTPFREDLSFGDDTQFAVDLWKRGVPQRMIEEPLTIYDDPYQPDRLSQSPAFLSGGSPEHVSFVDWVETQRSHMSESTYLAYRAFFRSRFLSRAKPWQALKDIWIACFNGPLSIKQSLAQTLQTFTPGLYRRLADLVVRHKGSQVAPLMKATDSLGIDGTTLSAHTEAARATATRKQ